MADTNPDLGKAKEKAVRIIRKNAEEYIDDAIEDTKNYGKRTTPTHVDLDIFIGSRRYHRKIENYLESRDLDNFLDYESFLKILISHYLSENLRDSEISQWDDKDYYPAPYPGLINDLNEKYGLSWDEAAETSKNGDSLPHSIWMYFFPEDRLDELEAELDRNLSTFLPDEFRDALIGFPRSLNRHNLEREDNDWNWFCATVQHELTHNFISRTGDSSKKNGRSELLDELHESAAQFTSFYVYVDMEYGKGLKFENKREIYEDYDIDTDNMHYFIEIFRAASRIESEERGGNFRVLDFVRQKCVSFLQEHERTRVEFLKTFTPEHYRVEITRFEKFTADLESPIKNLREELEELRDGKIVHLGDGRMTNSDGEKWRKIIDNTLEDLSKINPPSKITHDILDEGYGKMIERNEGFDHLENVIEKELKIEIRSLLRLEEDISELEKKISRKNLEKEIKHLEKFKQAFSSVESDLEHLLEYLEE